jgi:hypothetical protein
MRKAIIYLAFAVILSQLVIAAGEIYQFADMLNYYESRSHTTTFINNGNGPVKFNVSKADGFKFTSCSNCVGFTDSKVSFNLAPNASGSYTVSSNASYNPLYKLTTLPISINNSYTVASNLSYVRIPDKEIFYTLVEYGRGRGNYFYSTMDGKAGSGHTGVGCPYIPNGTMFELNFLHKIFNVRQYYNDPNLLAENASFTCSYPNRTIVRTHLGTAISQNPVQTNVSYLIDEIEGSWERMGYLGMDFDAAEQSVGENLTISCRSIVYSLPSGNITVFASGTSFNLQVRDRNPFTASASTSATIGNGTQEVLIIYNITNNELYTANNPIIEIDAPQYAAFIGTRGEIWGTAQDQYRVEKTELQPGESEIITLVARFDTANAPNITAVNLTGGIKIKFTPCWEVNAYNPAEYMQYLSGVGTGAVNMGIPSKIISIIEQINQTYIILKHINITSIAINSTVNRIETLVKVINQTTIDTNKIVKQINNTVNNISSKTTIILNNTVQIINDTSVIKELIDCDNISDSPICSALDYFNSTIINISNLVKKINITLSNLSINITINLTGQNISINVTPDLTNITIIIDDIIDELNCSMNWTTEPNSSICKRLLRIENNTITINNTINDINSLVYYFNNTVFGNITLQDIYDALSNITVDTSELIREIEKIRAFDEELVFLVTDAFGLQQAARADVDNGDLGSAAQKLREANDRLSQATARLMQEQKTASDRIAGGQDSSFGWVLAVVLGIIAAGALFLYLFSKPKTE